VPPDVAEHRRACADCRRAWEEAAEDLRTVRDSVPPAPAALERRIRIRLADGIPPRPGRCALRFAWYSAVGAAVALASVPALPPPVAAVGPLVLAFAGASLAFAAGTIREGLLGRIC
jgi:predicted anti-sigma-YlaC factor YlaD